MNIIEQADKYAEGKANEAITKAIADAYIEGYKAGYKDRDEEIPYELRCNKTEYIDLGLPSGTLWSTDYEKENDCYLYLPYMKAEQMKLPTIDQWKELQTFCKWEYKIDNCFNFSSVRCIGPNGQSITFERTGRRNTSEEKNWDSFFWLESSNDCSEKTAAHIYNAAKSFNRKNGSSNVGQYFSGYMLPIRTVK